MSDAGLLFRQFLRDPTRVATVTASSPALVAAMLAPLDLDGDPVVVELGAGTGRVTDGLVERLGGRGRHVAIELDPTLAARLARRHPGVTVVPGNAADLPALLRGLGIDRVDGISSLLPWVAWARAPIAGLAASVLAPEGVLAQVSLLPTAWMPPARRQLAAVRGAFRTVDVRGPVWGNLPPARVLAARGPL
ncbi:MAG: NAD-binding protein [Pseudonocardiales bacterium]|nr:NAD-binding protein [Pseudonocardiales bacterium]